MPNPGCEIGRAGGSALNGIMLDAAADDENRRPELKRQYDNGRHCDTYRKYDIVDTSWKTPII